MKEKIDKTALGDIHYWVNILDKNAVTLVLLPGLTADHRLFEKQIHYFTILKFLFIASCICTWILFHPFAFWAKGY